MKFTIELDDFWMDEENSGSLECQLKQEIIDETTRRIRNDIKGQVENEIVKKVDEFITSRMSVVINDKIAECIKTGVIKAGRQRSEIRIEDYIKEKFEDDIGWSSPNKHISKIAEEFGRELRLQYNNVFANKIVQNMREHGFLKDEISQMLLESK